MVWLEVKLHIIKYRSQLRLGGGGGEREGSHNLVHSGGVDDWSEFIHISQTGMCNALTEHLVALLESLTLYLIHTCDFLIVRPFTHSILGYSLLRSQSIKFREVLTLLM